MKTVYPVAIHKEVGSDYGVSVPDMPGCIGAGSTVAEALANVREAIAFHAEGMNEDGEAIPTPTRIEDWLGDNDYADAQLWAAVEVDLSAVRGRTRRYNVTLPETLVDRLDAAAQAKGSTRSGLLAELAGAYLAKAAVPATRPE